MSTWGYSYLATHPNEAKPSIPYQPGTTIKAQAYTPPKPPNFYYTWARGKIEKDIREIHPLQLCLENLPAEGHPRNRMIGLRIKRHVRVHDGANSQIVQAEFLSNQEKDPQPLEGPIPTSITVKFYDPLYYDFDTEHPDPFANCDAAFAHETLAYHHLKPVYGTVVPRFLGSYSIDVPLPGNPSVFRPVRAILYEFVPGVSLQDIEIQDYSSSQRKAIMSAVLDAHSILRQLNVAHGDLDPRNVIVISAKEGEKADIRLIDFDMAECGKRIQEQHQPTMLPESRSIIIKRWSDKDLRDCMLDFAWLIDWPWDDWLENEYAKDRI
ncbi:uncharacterized protein JN550_013822 [Neoarthrinium moseri]|uniref:uncharacterized protein n=1 Tax=Neoarthrinium moseri TaxID=1658444 RepID=UPI001FDAE40C|nr:uncharacterized protein JN550_013822 [Neoarthrinium moseri]KAI1856348.1 hypothetical protein JN550_013822 [Neoarthrinium moseri]